MGGYTAAGTPYSADDTSRAAAESLDAETLRRRVLDFIAKQGLRGATCDEVEAGLAMAHQTVSARIWELTNKYGAISRNGKQRLTRAGRFARVYVAKEQPVICVGNMKYGLRSGVLVDRTTKWGNPHWAQGRTDNINAYARYVLTRPDLLAALPELTGKSLLCWCAPKPCHADILLWLANGDIATNIEQLHRWVASQPAEPAE